MTIEKNNKWITRPAANVRYVIIYNGKTFKPKIVIVHVNVNRCNSYKTNFNSFGCKILNLGNGKKMVRGDFCTNCI